MIYSAWYFCNAIKLSIVETQDILKTIRALENEYAPFAWKKQVLKQIRTYNPTVQAYLIPYLTEGLLSPEMRVALDRSTTSEERQQYVEQVEDILSQLLPEKKNQALISLIQNLSEIEYETAVQFVTDFRFQKHDISELSSLYSDITQFTLELFLLSVLNCASFANPELVVGLVRSEESLELIQNALNRNYGQLCWLLSMRLWIQSGIPAYEAILAFPGDWLTKPDMAELAANILFPDDQADHSIDEILAEAYKLQYFQRYWKENGNDELLFWATQNTNAKDRVRCCIMLWQAILWELALKRNPDAFLSKIIPYWNAPGSNADTIKETIKFNKYQELILPEKCGIEKPYELMRYICSPWQLRSSTKHTRKFGDKPNSDVSDEEQTFHEFSLFRYSYYGLRAFLAVHLLNKIFLLPQKRIDYCFITLLLNLGDAFSCYGARNTFFQITSTPNDNLRVAAWPPPIRAFGYYAQDTLSNIGSGLVNPRLPSIIVSNILSKTHALNPKYTHYNKQSEYLYDSSIAIQVGLHWAFESMSATGISLVGCENNWLAKGRESNAAKLCKGLFDKFSGEALGSREVIQLNLQAFDSAFTTKFKKNHPFWLKKVMNGNCKSIRLNELLLCRNPTYTEWCKVESFTTDVFLRDAYTIAHTLRIMALMDSDEPAEQHAWTIEWIKTFSEISNSWGVSRLSRYIMIQLLDCVPKNKNNHQTLLDLCKQMITVVQEFSGLNDIFYQYQLAQKLIGMTSVPEEKRAFGDETVAHLRGIYAKNLYNSMETAASPEEAQQWEVLLRYYLLHISDSLQETVLHNAGDSLREYWKAQIIAAYTLRSELIAPSKWNPLLDHLWSLDGDKLQTVRNAVPTDQSGNSSSSWEQICLPDSKPSHILGVVASCEHASDGNTYKIFCADGKLREKKIYSHFSVGSLVRLKLMNQSIYMEYVNRSIFQGDRTEVEYILTARELTIEFLNQTQSYNVYQDYQLFQLWNGDLSELYAHNQELSGRTIAEYIEYQPGKKGWLPIEQDYIHLLLNVLLTTDNKEQECTLAYLGEAMSSGCLLFSTRAGNNYALSPDCWTSESWSQIEELLLGAKDNTGMRINVCIKEQNKLPYLELKGELPFDDRNIRWREQFSNDQIFQVIYNNNRWETNSSVPEIHENLGALIHANGRNLYTDRCYNVQLHEDGWNYANQRIGFVETTELKSRFLNISKIDIVQLKKLITLESGDIIQLRSVRTDKHNYGYYPAELTSGIPVFCAAESYSFIPNKKNKSFFSDRFCIVENINCRSVNEHELLPAIPVFLPELQSGDKIYQGITAEFTPSVRMENTGNIILKILLDVNGEKVGLNVPISAFSIRPNNLGDLITAQPKGEGWIFQAYRRSINVRALWMLENHKKDKTSQITGVYLDLVRISRFGDCIVTQDQEKPILHLWTPNADLQQVSKTRCGVHLGKGKVTSIGHRFSSRKIFPNAYRTDIVVLQSDRQTIVGETSLGMFKRPESNWRVDAKINCVCYTEDTALYDLRRRFIASESNRQNENSLNDSVDDERKAYYEDWKSEGDYHARCAVSGSLSQAHSIQLHDLAVPADPSSYEIGEVVWISNIPLIADMRPRVSGRRYSLSDIRVKMIIQDNSWGASIQDIEPLFLDQSFLKHFNSLDGDRIEKNFYFAGRDHAGRLYFEWGYGYCFSARMEDIIDEFENCIGTELFFGDRIAAFTLQKSPGGEFGWRLIASQSDIYNEVEAQIWKDAELQIIQLLKVKKDEKIQQVQILEASVMERKLNDSASQKNGWIFKRIFNAKLGVRSNEVLLKRLAQKEEVIFAELNQTDYQKDSPVLEFNYISVDGIGDSLSALENKVVCLTAGSIRKNERRYRSQIKNNYKIDFFLPNEFSENVDNYSIQVSVSRRDFSIDESILRVLASKKPDTYKGCNMLVRLQNITQSTTPGVWFGSVLAVPQRSLESLKVWLENQTSNLVTVGVITQDEKKIVLAEIFPGIVFQLPASQDELTIHNGTIATLQLVDDEIRSTVVLPSDEHYIPEWDTKPIELLIMDGVLNHYSPDNEENNENHEEIEESENNTIQKRRGYGAHFTVAGFPQLRLKKRSLLEKLVRQEPPRIASIRKSAERFILDLPDPASLAGYLTISDETQMPTVRLIFPEEKKICSSWSQLSFKDGSIDQIAEYVRHGAWHCHDQFTGVYSDEEGKMIPRQLSDGRNYQDILVFFNGACCNLRYQEKDLLRFGMSAREIIENGLPFSSSGVFYFPVAGSTEKSIWIEIYPGKILEIPRTYLFIGKDKLPLSQLYTNIFSVGDELWLNTEESQYGERGRITLSGFRFGMRSAFANYRAFLPIRKHDRKNVLDLGAGHWTLQYPLPEAKKSDFQNNSIRLAVIDSNNQISSDNSDMPLQKGDCAMLYFYKGLKIYGKEHYRVELSREADWSSAQWLYHLIKRDPEVALSLLGKIMPVQINGISPDSKIAYVSYRQQECGEISEGTVLCCNCIQMYTDSEQGTMIILRSGGYLFLIHGEELISSVDKKTLGHIVNRISKKGHGFFMTKTEKGWKSGLNLKQTRREREIILLCHIPEGDGILCRDKRDLSLLWLPIEYASRVKDVPQEELWDILREKQERYAVTMNGSVISLNHTESSQKQYRLLTLNSDNYRVIPRKKITKENRHHIYLCEMYPTGELLLLRSEMPLETCEIAKTEDDIVYVEIVQKDPASIIAIPRGEKRWKIYLSPWILEAYRQSYIHNKRKTGSDFINLELWRSLIPERFEKYKMAVLQAETDFKSGAIADAVFSAYSTEEKLVYLHCALQKRQDNRIVGQLFHRVAAALSDWLRSAGKLLTDGLNQDVPARSYELDLLPTIAAILLLFHFDLRCSDNKKLAIHLTHMLGFACSNSIHQEILLRMWLMLGNQRGLLSRLQKLYLGGKTRSETWELQKSMDFDGLLTSEQKDLLDKTAGDIAFHYPDRHEVKLPAMSLLHAVGDRIDYNEYFRLLKGKNLYTEKLAPLGRILTPPLEQPVQYSDLFSTIEKLLKTVFNGLARQSFPIPLELITDIQIPLSVNEKNEMSQLREKCIQLLNAR